MTKKDIRNAYDSINPTSAQKDRMLSAILSATPQEKPVRGEYTGAPAKTRWWTAIPAAAVLICVVFAGFWIIKGTDRDHSLSLPSENETEMTNPSETENDVVEPTQNETDPSISPYETVLDLYARAIAENWDQQKYVDNGINYMVSYPEVAEQIGYALIDLDNDGREELLISDGDVIYDMYAMTDLAPKQILTGTERNVYQLCELNYIANRGSGSAFNTVYNFYWLQGTELELYEFILFDAYTNENDPWFGGFKTTHENAQPLTEAQAQAVIDSYKVVSVEIKPLEAEKRMRDESNQEDAQQMQPDILQAYADYVAWLMPWRIEAFVNPQQLYYSLTDYNEDGIVDLLLGYEDEFNFLWTYSNEFNDITPLSADEAVWDELEALWLELDLTPIEEFPMDA